MHTCTVVEQNKAIITYVQLLKEDLAIFRLVPDNGVVPEYDAGQFITIGMPIPSFAWGQNNQKGILCITSRKPRMLNW